MRLILVATDGSPSAAVALDFALDLARSTNAALLIAHVVEPMRTPLELPPGEALRAVSEAMRSGALSMLEDARRRAEARGVRAETVLAEGNVPHELMILAQKEQPDLLVCGSHGRGPVSRVLLGSVSTKLVQLSPVPVLVVPWRERRA